MSAKLLEYLARNGSSTASAVADALGISVDSVTRMANASPNQIARLGNARATRYALFEPIVGGPALRNLFWITDEGDTHLLGQLTNLACSEMHVGTDAWNEGAKNDELPWFLKPVSQAGFIGRAVAQRLAQAPTHFSADPKDWKATHHLFAATQPELDVPGAIVVGEASVRAWFDRNQLAVRSKNTLDYATDYEALASVAGQAHSIGSSAAGEQPKFSTQRADGTHVLVKFTPPLQTPYGQIWNDLLHAEWVASEVLRDHGIKAAWSQILQTSKRSFLESERIDRKGAVGRSHAVSLAAIHSKFVNGSQVNWPATAQALLAQRRLSKQDNDDIALIFRFGKLIGNTDMHFGNLSLTCETIESVKKGRFTLAPVYDMLPMRYKPDPLNEMGYLRFTPERAVGVPADVELKAKLMGIEFWSRIANLNAISKEFRICADQMKAVIEQI
jgi:hypothetical protein